MTSEIKSLCLKKNYHKTTIIKQLNSKDSLPIQRFRVNELFAVAAAQWWCIFLLQVRRQFHGQIAGNLKTSSIKETII